MVIILSAPLKSNGTGQPKVGPEKEIAAKLDRLVADRYNEKVANPEDRLIADDRRPKRKRRFSTIGLTNPDSLDIIYIR